MASLSTRPIIEIEGARKTVVNKPPIVHEYIVPEHQQVVQPVIHREIIKTEIRRITQPTYEEVTKEAQIHEAELPKDLEEKFGSYAEAGSVLEFLETRNEGPEPKIITTYATPVRKRVMLQPIIIETVIPEIIEEIQPIVHRKVHESHIIKKQVVVSTPIFLLYNPSLSAIKTEETVEQVVETKEVMPAMAVDSNEKLDNKEIAFDTTAVKAEIEHIETNVRVGELGPGSL